MLSVMIDSDLVVIVQAQLDQAALGCRGLIASEQRSEREELKTMTVLRK